MSRNPYLLLGIDYGAPPAAARRAFAHAVKRLRRNPASTVTREELTGALHEIEHANTDPAEDVSHYRVPADPAVFRATGPGLLKPAAVPLGPTGRAPDVGELASAAADELADVLDEAVAASAHFDHGYVFDDGRHHHGEMLR